MGVLLKVLGMLIVLGGIGLVWFGYEEELPGLIIGAVLVVAIGVYSWWKGDEQAFRDREMWIAFLEGIEEGDDEG